MHGLIEANTEALGGMASPSGGIMTGGKSIVRISCCSVDGLLSMAHMRKTVATNHLPDYRIELDDDFVIFHKREAESSEAKPALPPPARAVAPAQAPLAAMGVKTSSSQPEARPKIFISLATLEQVREMFPRIDIYWLENAYTKWAQEKEPAPKRRRAFSILGADFYAKECGIGLSWGLTLTTRSRVSRHHLFLATGNQ